VSYIAAIGNRVHFRQDICNRSFARIAQHPSSIPNITAIVYFILKNLVLPRQGGIFDGPCLPRIAGVRVLWLCLKNCC